MLDERSVRIEADGNAIVGISVVAKIISPIIENHIHVIAVVPIARPGFRPRIDHTEPKAAVLEALLSANIHHVQTTEEEPVILAVILIETGIRDAVAVVTAALLPGPVLRLPIMCTIALERSLLLAHLIGAALLC